MNKLSNLLFTILVFVTVFSILGMSFQSKESKEMMLQAIIVFSLGGILVTSFVTTFVDNEPE